MRKIIFILSALIACPALAADHFELDKERTTIMFFVNYLGFSDIVGLFTAYNGTFTFDPADPENSTLDITLKPSGIRTSSLLLDQKLWGKDFFNVHKFPTIHFVSTGVTITGHASGDIAGKLTMLGVTRPVTLHAHFNKTGYHPITQDYVAGFSARATIKRSDFGMNYLLPMVSDKVRVVIETEGIDIDRKNAQMTKH